MESVKDRTMKSSGLPLFPQTLEIAKERRFPHSHRTTTTTNILTFLSGESPCHFY